MVKWKTESLYWLVILKTRTNFYYLEEHMQLGSLCLLFKTTRRHTVLFALFNVSYGYLFCSTLWFYAGSLQVENSSYASCICFIQWLLVFCHGVKCRVFWRLLKLIKLEYFPGDVLVFYSEWWRWGGLKVSIFSLWAVMQFSGCRMLLWTTLPV